MQLGEAAQPGVALRDRGAHLLRPKAGADNGRGHVEPGRIDEHGRITQRRSGLRHREVTEALQVLAAEPLEVLLPELRVRAERQLRVGEVGVERAGGRRRVDVDQPRNPRGQTIARRVANHARTAVDDQHDRHVRRLDRGTDRGDVVLE